MTRGQTTTTTTTTSSTGASAGVRTVTGTNVARGTACDTRWFGPAKSQPSTDTCPFLSAHPYGRSEPTNAGGATCYTTGIVRTVITGRKNAADNRAGFADKSSDPTS